MAIRFFDMFAGIGGFRSGLEAVGGFKCIGHCEIDKKANTAYCAIYDTEGEYFCDDARKIDPKRMPDFDLICAGFPCQSFSVSGKRRGFSDMRGTLIFEVARIVGEKRPAFLLLENVPGLLSHDGGRTFETILSTFADLGYTLEWCVHNSKFFGVPQSRKRLYIVGYLGGRCVGEIFPLACGDGSDLKQLIPGPQGQRVYDVSGVACTQTAGAGGWGGKTGLYFIDLNSDPKITDAARCVTARQDSGVSKHRGEHSGVLVEEGPRAILRPDREKTRQNGRRMKEPEEPMFTLTAQDRHGVYHRGRIRKLTPRECISRLDYGKKYCTESITVDEQALQRAIVRALNRFNVEDEATYLLLMKSTIGEAVGINGSSDEIDLLERRIDALNKRMLDLVSLSVQEGDDAENHEDDFKNISTQIEQLTKRITAIRESESENGDFQARLKEIQDIIDKRRENKDIYDDSIVRQMVECIKVYHDGRLQIILGGGYELEEYLEK